MESEIDVFEDVIEIYIDAAGKNKEEYVGKLLPTKIVLRTRIPMDWESESFRNTIWNRINNRLSKGKICELGESDWLVNNLFDLAVIIQERSLDKTCIVFWINPCVFHRN